MPAKNPITDTEAFRDALGTEPDPVTGRRFGVSTQTVQAYRRAAGIPSYVEVRRAQVDALVAACDRSTSAVAREAGVSRRAVTKRRPRGGVPRLPVRHGSRGEARGAPRLRGREPHRERGRGRSRSRALPLPSVRDPRRSERPLEPSGGRPGTCEGCRGVSASAARRARPTSRCRAPRGPARATARAVAAGPASGRRRAYRPRPLQRSSRPRRARCPRPTRAPHGRSRCN